MNNFDSTQNQTRSGGFKSLAVYWLAKEIYYLNFIFCERYIPKTSRTFDQMVQAARSCKQNIVEGSLENSSESNLKLSGVARASFGELIEDYEDFLWQKNLRVWGKDDPRVLRLRAIFVNPHETHVTHETHEWHCIAFSDAEGFANLLVTLCTKEGFLMDKFLEGVKNRFVREGGMRERLFRERVEFKQGHGSH